MQLKKTEVNLATAIGSFFFATAAVAEMTPQQLFFERHCTDCHDDETAKGNFNLMALQVDLSNPDNLAKWKHVYDRIESGEMPPKKKSRPPEADKTAALATLYAQITLAEEKSLIENGGRSVVRRMNRTEYENTLRDLLSLPMLNVKELLPEDGQKFGFDKVAGALDISHIQMTKYLQTADLALRQAMMPIAEKPLSTTWRESAAQQGSAQSAISVNSAVPLKGHHVAPGLTSHVTGNATSTENNSVVDPNSYRAATFSGNADSVAVLTGVIGAHQPLGIQMDRFQPKVAGWYQVKFSIWSLRWERDKAVAAMRGKPVHGVRVFGNPFVQKASSVWEGTKLAEEVPEVGWIQNVELHGKTEVTEIVRASLNGAVLGFYNATSLTPTTHEVRVWLNPSDKISFHAMTLPSSGPNNWPSYDGIFSYNGPGLAYDWFEVTGPINDQWPPSGQRLMFGENPMSDSMPENDRVALMESFAERAFRRPLSAGEMAPYAAIVEAEIKRGSKLAEAMIAGYKAILCSPDFLFIGLESGIPGPSVGKLVVTGGYALASRLSYFLWNSMPDSTLIELAAKQSLTRPGILKKEVERMLVDKRSDRFVDHFTDEWLELKKIDATSPDPNLYPDFDPWLRDSMLEETRATFRRMIMQNRSVSELVSSDSVLVNQRLAELYGIKGVNGAELREVELPESSPRGGFLTQASVLKVTANGTATSPVLRGLWVMERILGIPRGQVPPNTPAIEPDATGAVTIRQMIEKHRADPACASCHSKMDPPGLALESFDVIGGYRDRYRLAGNPKPEEPQLSLVTLAAYGNRVNMRLGPEVDASGVLANGQTFANLTEYRNLLLEHDDVLARNVVRQLVIYATGAGIRFSDRDDIAAIVFKTEGSKHGMRSLIQEIVASSLFQSK